MTKLVALIASEDRGKKPSVRQRKRRATLGLRRTSPMTRMTSFDRLAKTLGYELVRGSSVAIRSVAVSEVKETEIYGYGMPSLRKMTFTEACNLSRNLSESREERLMSASFDDPE
ncbi:hypothetical protein AM354_21585 [Serratia marcescens]|uniref:hypothetical protein n=1 Tax=Serratia marcescens TaxID=615 RepID=UPI000CE6673C|nr:hypothetical protein [Serratia marcescens]AVE52005.1 hypothetical protein AM354_21585 [Serratia marcescens]